MYLLIFDNCQRLNKFDFLKISITELGIIFQIEISDAVL
jgi:hypothetical protein